MLTPEDIIDLKEGGRRLMAIFKETKEQIRPGVSLLDLEKLADNLFSQSGGLPSFKGYKGYPSPLCLSVNQVVVHGVPTDYILKEGDILAIDMGMYYRGWHTDAAVTLPVGNIAPEARRLLAGAYAALLAGTEAVREGNHVQDVSKAIEQILRGRGLTIFRQLVGHGIGRELHLDPMIPNFDSGSKGMELKSGLVVALEPIAGLGKEETRELPDGWTIETADGRLAAHFEHSILLTPSGPEVLTPLDELISRYPSKNA